MEQMTELAILHEEVFGNSKGYMGDSSDSVNENDPYPKGHLAFDYQGAILTPAVGSSASILTFTVPLGYDGFINQMSNVYLGGGFVPSAQDLVWRLTADGKAIRNFEAIYAQKGSLETPRPINGIRVYSGQVITLTVEHLANVMLTGDTAGTLGGYFYPAVNQ